MSESRSWSTTNLGIAAYVLERGASKGIRLESVVKTKDYSLTGTFIIGGDPDLINELVLSFQDSPEKKFDDMIRYLKTLCKQGLAGQQRD